VIQNSNANIQPKENGTMYQEKMISKRKSKYYRLGCRTLPSIIVIDKIVIVLENKEKRYKEMIAD